MMENSYINSDEMLINIHNTPHSTYSLDFTNHHRCNQFPRGLISIGCIIYEQKALVGFKVMHSARHVWRAGCPCRDVAGALSYFCHVNNNGPLRAFRRGSCRRFSGADHPSNTQRARGGGTAEKVALLLVSFTSHRERKRKVAAALWSNFWVSLSCQQLYELDQKKSLFIYGRLFSFHCDKWNAASAAECVESGVLFLVFLC